MDEVIHVASALQMIGFPHAIGTLWEVDDKTAVKVAGAFYKALMKGINQQGRHSSHDAVAYALHEAVRELKESKSSDTIAWAPFIHLGA
jgi:CHAT domain-containing protein